MKKKEFVDRIKEKTGWSVKDVMLALNAIRDVTYEGLKEGKTITLIDGVRLSTNYKEEHSARNPKTGDLITVPGKYIPKCKFGQTIKVAIN